MDFDMRRDDSAKPDLETRIQPISMMKTEIL